MDIKPILKAMILCDQTMIEEGTRKRTLIGLFDRIKAAKLSITHPYMSVYVQFREIEGIFNFTLELYDIQADKTLHKAVVQDFKVQEKSRDCELVFNIQSVKFEHYGEYEFRIYVNDMIFGQKSFQVVS